MLTETANHVSPDMPEDGSMHESLTMEQFNSPLVSPQYKSTYAIVATSGEFYNMKSFAHSFEWHWWNFFPNPLVIKPSIRLFPLLPSESQRKWTSCRSIHSVATFYLYYYIIILRAYSSIFLGNVLVLAKLISFHILFIVFTNFFYKVFN